MLLFKQEVYSSYSVEKTSHVRSILKENGIRYTLKVKDPSGSSTGISSHRGNFGSFGMKQNFERLYSISVNKKDAEVATSLIHRHVR